MTLLHPGIAPLADHYDGFILDLWGVVHDGIRPYPGVIDCLDRLRAAGKGICVLSNAPRRNASVVRKLDGMGVGREQYHHLYTSGEAVYEHLAARPDRWYRGLGRRLFHLGPPRDADVYVGLDYAVVDAPEAADFVVNTGIDDFDETLADYEPVLARCRAAGLPMICANPDLVVNVGTKIAICAGLLAQRYEELGGDVRYHGKPHPPVYDRCRELLGITDARRILAVGDSLRTDVAGANRAGIDVVLVTGGIHKEETALAGGDEPDPAKLTELAAATGFRPDYAVSHFRW